MKLNLDEALRAIDRMDLPRHAKKDLADVFRALCKESLLLCKFGDLITDGRNAGLFLNQFEGEEPTIHVLITQSGPEKKSRVPIPLLTECWISGQVKNLNQNFSNKLNVLISGLRTAEISLKNKHLDN